MASTDGTSPRPSAELVGGSGSSSSSSAPGSAGSRRKHMPKSADTGEERRDSAAMLIEFLQDDPDDELDVFEFLSVSAPTTEVYVNRRPLSKRSGNSSSKDNLSDTINFGYDGKSLAPDKLAALVAFLRQQSELNRTHTHSLKRYPSCFCGDDLVSLLVRRKIAETRDAAAALGQQLVDAKYVWHAEVDQQFKDSSAPYRFTSPEVFALYQAVADPSSGIAVATLPAPPTIGKGKRDSNVKSRGSLLNIPSTSPKVSFTGKELLEWMLKSLQPKPKNKDAAVKAAQSLVDTFVIQSVGGTAEEQTFGETNSYTLTRQKISVQSLSGATRKEWLSCQIAAQIGKGKWKERFCILVADQQLLYMFNSEDALVPRSIVNLRSAIIRPVEESLIGKSTCVSITTDAGSAVIDIPASEARNSWLDSLHACAGERQTEKGRQSRSFRIKIVEGRNLPGGSYFCTLNIGEASVARTSVQLKIKNGCPTWGDEFFFVDVPSTVEEVRVTALSKGQLNDQELGSVPIQLSTLSSHAEVEEWFELRPAGRQSFDKKSMPALNLRFTLEYELILPLTRYEGLLTLIMSDYKLLASLLSLTTTEREQVSQTVLRIFMTQGKASDFVMELVRREIAATMEKNVLFRVNTVGTKAVVEYLKLAGVSYVRDTIRPFLLSMDKYNIDPDKSVTLLPAIRDLWDIINTSIVRMPPDLFSFFYELSAAAITRFPAAAGDDVATNVGHLVVNGFFFLRLLCPAIVAPKLYGVTDSLLEDRTTQILKTLARVLQYLANFKAEVDRDVFDAEGATALNVFLKEQIPTMKSFIRQISNRENASTQKFNLGKVELNVDLERELANLYATIIRYNQELLDLCRVQTRNALSNVMEDISSCYKETWPGRSTPYQYKISLADAMLFLK